ncbi:MAG: aminotransferase, partial [Gammaproteobacteria bacterium]|nr:aminotransferase [Gammaproteobacteria bacterium]
MIEYESLAKLNAPYKAEFEAVLGKIVDKGWFILGQSVAQFEQEFAQYCGAKHCVGVANGLDALILSLIALDLPAGSEVIVPSNTYIATILAILRAGLKPVLVEPSLATYNLDPHKIESAITSRTRAIMPVHLYGKLCDMQAILALAKKHDLFVVEDAAQAHGAMQHDRKAGAWGDMTAFSFYPTKNLGALGDAGAITTDNDKLAEKLRSLRNYGSQVKYYNDYVGFNSRLDEVQAAFLLIKLRRIDAMTQHKRELATFYFKHIDDRYIKPVIQDGFFDVYHIYNIRHEKRDELKQFLLEQGIKT